MQIPLFYDADKLTMGLGGPASLIAWSPLRCPSLVFIGKSGAGKSTAAQIALGRVKRYAKGPGARATIDNIVMDLYISSPLARDELMVLLDKLPITYAVEVLHWSSFRPGTFREQFTIRFQDGASFWIGAVLNGRKPEWGRVRMDFNPNKVAEHEVFQLLLGYLVGNTRTMHRAVRRYDLAVDIPVLRRDAFLVKDSRAYLERRHGMEWTQYLGAKSSTVGRVKMYNKAVEAGLNYPLTRLEMTLDPATPYEKVNFPTAYYLDDYQLCFSGQKATDTERFIINALLEGCETLDQLGRGTREKIKKLLNDYVQVVEISRESYEQVISQVKAYASGKVGSTATEQDQPPPQGTRLPAWVREAEGEAFEEMLT